MKKTLQHYAESMWLFPFWLKKASEGPKRLEEDEEFIYFESVIPRPYITDMVMNPEYPKKRKAETGEEIEENIAFDWPGYKPWPNENEPPEVQPSFNLGLVFLPVYYDRESLKQAVREGKPAFVFTPTNPILLKQDRSYLYYKVRVPKIFFNEFRGLYDDPLYQVPKPRRVSTRRVLKPGIKKEEATDADYDYFPIFDEPDPLRINLDAMHPTLEEEASMQRVFKKVLAEGKEPNTGLWRVETSCERCGSMICSETTSDPWSKLQQSCPSCGSARVRLEKYEPIKPVAGVAEKKEIAMGKPDLPIAPHRPLCRATFRCKTCGHELTVTTENPVEYKLLRACGKCGGGLRLVKNEPI